MNDERMDIRVSVAMTTYNGSKYIISQLDSILNQTRTPDEVVICDDSSSDNTVYLIKKFISDNNLSNWRVEINNPNLGWKANFYKAIGLTTGEIIFFSDQDDIWLENKIEMMTSYMVRKKMGALFANKQYVNSEGVLIPERQEKKYFSGKLTKIKLKPSFYEIKTLGCCMCINRYISDKYLELGFNEDDHDSQCGRLALLFSSLWYLDIPVIKYRIHPNNSSGISGVASYGQSTKEIRLNAIKLYINWINAVIEKLPAANMNKDMLVDIKLFLSKRQDYFEGRTTLLYLISHLKYYTGLAMLAGDFSYKHGINRSLGMVMWKLRRLLNR